jgi:phage gpG-like protein
VVRDLKAWDAGLAQAAGKGLGKGLQKAVQISMDEFFRHSRAGGNSHLLVAVSGVLRTRITSRVMVEGDRVRGMVGTNVVYGAYHEYGFRGEQNVREHSRVLKAFKNGKELLIKRRTYHTKNEVLGYKEGLAKAVARVGATARTVTVRAHQRRVDYAGKPFVAPAVRKAVPVITREIFKATKLKAESVKRET